MKTHQVILHSGDNPEPALAAVSALDPQLILVFGAVERIVDPALVAALSRVAPQAVRIGCSTAGEIAGESVADQTCVVTAIRFEATAVRMALTPLADMADSSAAGERLARALEGKELRAVLVLGQGIGINGSALVRGMEAVLGTETPVFGGLAGDGGAFRQTWVLANGQVSDRELVAVGL